MSDGLLQFPDVAVATRKAETGSVERVSANFHKSLWGDHFMSNDFADDSKGPGEADLKSEYEILKEEVRNMLTTTKPRDDVIHKLQLIDEIQRLGVGYLFEPEIETGLEQIHAMGEDVIFSHKADGDDLYHLALWFRLLRQQGFVVSPDVFTKFKDSEGNFNEALASDEPGMLGLYEAAHLAAHGEDILDEALAFATNNLKPIIQSNNDHKAHSSSSSSSFVKQVKFALSLPLWKCIPRTVARNYIDFYSDEEENAAVDRKKLLRFAKLDFNLLQKLHQRELREITEWWERLQVTVNFSYARDRVVEGYYWMHGVYFEPKYHLARIILTKIILMLSLLDDTYDNFATYEEVEILTQAIQRLDICCLETLPDTMKNIYPIIIELYEEIETELAKIGPTFGVEYAKEELKRICRSYLVEVQWRTKGHVPKMKDYRMAAYITGGAPVICTSAFLGMGPDLATREAFEWVTNEPKMVRATSAMCRLQNDIVSHQFEKERKHVATSVECYMKEHDVSEEEAIRDLWKEISEAWKDIVEACQKPSTLPVALTDRVLNFARSFNVIYQNGDGYTDSHLLKSHLASLFLHPIPLF